MITVTINSEKRKVAEGLSLSSLMGELDIPKEGTAVAVNSTVVPRSTHKEFIINDGDELEVITAVGGG